jgi:hypothetical protein
MMMINRKTALVCAALIALMLVAAVARIVLFGDWPILANQKAPLLGQMFLLPFIAAMMPVSLYGNGRRAIAIEAKVQPWYDWGTCLSIGICACTLLIQGLLILASLDLLTAALVWTLGLAILVPMAILVFQAINHMPKLPWFERGLFPAGELGPIYGPRYVRAHARIWIACFVAAMACFFALPRHAWPYIPLAFPLVLVGSKVLGLHYIRKRKLEQSKASGGKP